MYYHGQYCDNNGMKAYVEFICSLIRVEAGSSVKSKKGFPMKGLFVKVDLEIVDKMSRSIEIKMTSLKFEKKFIFYMSRHFGPEKILHDLQNKIDEKLLEVINENCLDQDQIYKDHHTLKNFKH